MHAIVAILMTWHYVADAWCSHLVVSIICSKNYDNDNYCNCFTAPWTVSGTIRVSRYQKGKTNLDLLEQDIVSGSD